MSKLRIGVVLVVQCISCAEPCRPLARHSPPRDASSLGDDEPRPRCDPAEQTCGPEPVGRVDEVCFRPNAERELLPPGTGGFSEADRCAHDGECVIAGCGNACVGYRRQEIITVCLGYDWLDEDAFCGCVEGRCAFFSQ